MCDVLKPFLATALMLGLAVAVGSCGRTDLEFSGTGQSGGVGAPGRDGGVDAFAQRGTGGASGSGGRTPTGSGGSRGSGGVTATGGRSGTGGRVNPGTGGVTSVDGGAARDAAADRPAADGGILPPPTPGRLVCGGEICNNATESCCVSVAGGSVGARCVPAGTACGGATLECDEPADCAGGVCCFGLQPGGTAGVSIGSRCVARATCNGLGRFVVCRANSDCGRAAPICCNSLGVPVCQAACPGG